MIVRVAALDNVQCPKCHAENIGRKIHVWKVADERGAHHECTVCAHDWKEPGQDVVAACESLLPYVPDNGHGRG